MDKVIDTALDALREIAELASDGQCDYSADANDQSPDDMTAHVNGLIWQRCAAILGLKKPEGWE